MTAGESVLAPTQVVMEHDTLVRLAVRRFVRHRLAITGLGILSVILAMLQFLGLFGMSSGFIGLLAVHTVHGLPFALRLIMTGSAVLALFAYCVWAFEVPTVHSVPWRPLTILPFAVCLFRYRALALGGKAEAPEDLLLADTWLQLAGCAWLVIFALGVHAAA